TAGNGVGRAGAAGRNEPRAPPAGGPPPASLFSARTQPTSCRSATGRARRLATPGKQPDHNGACSAFHSTGLPERGSGVCRASRPAVGAPVAGATTGAPCNRGTGG